MDRAALQLPDGLTAEEIVAIAARHGGRNVRVFGSRARGEARADSDLDLLVDMEPGRSLLDLATIKAEIEQRCRGRVDIHTPGGLSRYFRDQVLASTIDL
jgi:hypothetical protein